MNDRLQQYISRIESSHNLPILPHILVKLIFACQDENGSTRELARIIQSDASMAAKILKLANSSYFRSTGKIVQIDQALIRLGRNAVKNLAISSAVHQVFSKSDAVSNRFDLKRFWRHSLTSAALAKMIAEKAAYNLPEQAFLAGMIHDIGRLLLATKFPDEYKAVLDGAGKSGETLLEKETRTGFPHTEIGAWLLNRWNFDSMTVDAVRYHHEPAARIKESFPLVRIVYAANDLSRTTGSSDEAFCVLKGLFPCTFPDTVEMMLQAEQEVQELASFLGLSIGEKENPSSEGERIDIQTPDLVNEVRNFSLMAGVLQNLVACPDENAILKTIQEGLAVLFDMRKVIFFLFDPEDGLLKARVVTDQGRVEFPPGLVISKYNKDSLINRSIQEGHPLSSLTGGESEKPAILDEQIRHLLDCEGIFSLPLVRLGEKIGALVAGVDRPEEKALMREEKLLNLLVCQASIALYVERLKQAEARNIAVERLTAMTDLARKVVHEANNPLGIIKNYLKILSSRLDEENPAQSEIRVIGEEIDRITRILKELSHFAKTRSFKRATLDLNALLTDIVKIVGQALPKTSDIRIHTDLAPALPQIQSNRDALKQVYLNLVKNAVEAMKGRGNIFIESAYVPEAPDSSGKIPDAVARGHVKITVRDDGPGIPPEIETRLFEPYLSTKGTGHSGIGLSVVYNTIKELGGTVTCSSNPGKGAVFTIVLPVHST